MQNKTTVILTNEDAEMFKVFLKNYDKIALLLQRDVFNVKNGSVILDFDKDGQMQTIRLSAYLYSKRHDTMPYIEPTSYKAL